MFGWQFNTGPHQGCTITTPNVPGGINGGDQGAAPYVFFEVDDLDAAVEQVRQLGGKVEQMDGIEDEKSDALFGRFQICRDDQGSPFGLHQPPPNGAGAG